MDRSPQMSVFRTGLFAGKTAIVTGGATGIGNAISKELMYLGCNVVIASRKEDILLPAAKELNQLFGPAVKCVPVKCNIRQENDVKNLMSETLRQFNSIDFLVNNGGGQFPCPAADMSLKGWNAVIETNLTGTFLMCKQAYHSYMAEHGGSIVTIITDMWKGWPMMRLVDLQFTFKSNHSGAARAGVDNLTKSLAVEWVHNGIRVNAVAPGSSIWSSTAAASYDDPQLFQRRIPGIPARRLGTVEEVSGAVCYLLSPAAAYISGDTIKVDGGASLYSQTFWQVPDHKKNEPYAWLDTAKSKSKL